MNGARLLVLIKDGVALRHVPRFNAPAHTHRRSTDARDDVHGHDPIYSANPGDEDPWEWHCGFYPGAAWVAQLCRWAFVTAAVHSCRSYC